MTPEQLEKELKKIWKAICCNSGSSTFEALTDGPGEFTGHAGESVRVNGTEDALEYFAASGSGTVTDFVFTDGNGVDGTVSTSTTIPTLSLAFTPNGILKSNGTTLSAAVAGDFPTLNQNTTGSAASLSTVLALASGGTGAALVDPNADRLLFWDDSAGSMAFLTLGTNLSITGTTLDATGGGMTNPLTTTGDIIYSSSGTTPARLGIGATNEFLTVQSGIPAWDSINLVVTGVGTGEPVLFDLGTDILYHKAILGSTYVNVATVSNDIVLSLPITGTPTGSKYLRDDFSWQTVVAGGDVTKVGTPVNDQVGVWTGNGTIEGTTAWTFDGTTMLINAAAQASTAENLFKLSVSDDANSYLQIWNSTSAASTFTPLITGHAGASNTQSALTFTAQTTAALDNSTSNPLFSFDARRSTGAVITQRPLFAFKNFTTTYMQMSAGGQLGIGGVTGATEWLQIGAGTATISPIRLIAGTNLTTARTGAIEYNGTEFFMTATASNRRQVVRSDVATPANGKIPIGNGTDFTLANITGTNIVVTNGAGTIDIGIGSSVSTDSNTQTLTNKRITSRYGSTTSSATPTINTDNVDVYELTAQAVDITSFTTNLSGTPTIDQTLHIIITGTAARAITWGASFEASTVPLPTTTVTTNRLDVFFVWNATTSKWRCGGTW